MRGKRLSELRNLGPTSTLWLNEIGVFIREDVERLGSVEIYRLLIHHDFSASMNLVYALEAMLLDLDWRELPPNVKAELKTAIRNL